MARVKFPSAKPADKDGLQKSSADGNPEAGFSNTGGDKGAKVIGNASNSSAGRLKTYRTKVADLNTGVGGRLGGSTNLTNRGDQ